MSMSKSYVFLLILLLAATGGFNAALADHDEHGEGRHHRERHRGDHSGEGGKSCLTPVSNPVYAESCGECHFAYQPELLPSGSWEKILAGLEDHFGETVELDSAAKKDISGYLAANGAERSSAKRAVKIMKSLGGNTPLRITEIPCIKDAHHDISPDVLKRESIGSLSNCSACHTTAQSGIYNDDNVTIPK
ncbi:conserved exported hypothetical protein [uncultured Desulfobacterium sp.]|uniref:Diheme cytochrome c n=1 Tax=uncultured Desulfobacterium sp. TaxID=201089 RepID=A0A445MVR5_9BACT|nr:conserved exported hypothetical protein [uncultured Desulfobacterium sp.]